MRVCLLGLGSNFPAPPNNNFTTRACQIMVEDKLLRKIATVINKM